MYHYVKNVYGDDCLSRAEVLRLFTSFLECRESLEDDPRPGRPVSARSNENVEKTHAIVMQDRRITIGYSPNALESVRKRPGKFWKDICRKGTFVLSLCRTVKQFLAPKLICVIQHSSYSPDLAPAEFLFLFPKVKLALKGKRFSDSSDIQRGVIEQLKGVALPEFQCYFEDLYK
jgi:hypothetical protein